MLQQIGEVIRFDGRRNIKKTAATAAIYAVSFWLVSVSANSALNLTSMDAVGYASQYLSVIFRQFVLPLAPVIFGASIIVEDYEKKTGNLLFPLVSRGRLLFGRYVNRLACGSLSISVYYILIAIATAWEYGTVPGTLWGSLGWAIVYLHLLLSFMTLWSAALNRVATIIIVGMVLVLFVFNSLLFSSIAQIATVEPLFIPAYFAKIVSAWLNMPDPRFYQYIAPWGETLYVEWLTPSAEGTILFVALYTVIFLALAVLIYRRKEVKA